jgi:hypothetical protein
MDDRGRFTLAEVNPVANSLQLLANPSPTKTEIRLSNLEEKVFGEVRFNFPTSSLRQAMQQRPSELGSHNWFGYLNVDDVDALHAEQTIRGALWTLPTDKAYGMREIVVTTFDGHRIVFGQDVRR